MQTYEIKSFVQYGQEIEPFCDSCGQEESEVGMGKLLLIRINEDNELSLCKACVQKLVAAVAGEPAGIVIPNHDDGSHQFV